MASFLDKEYKFAPYIETTPVDEMVKVGMYKQQQYDEGVQKINDWLTQAASLPVSRPVDIEYLQNSIGNLTTGLRKVAGADFSNQQLLNSVGTAVNQLSADKNIIEAMKATKHISKQSEYMDEQKKAGKLTPQNMLNYNKKLNEYLSSTELGASFSYDYKDYFDVDKFAQETFDKVKPDKYSYDDLFQKNPDGTPRVDAKGNKIYSNVMQRMEAEGIFPERVRETLQHIFKDPRVQQQLAIDGEYNYANYSPQELVSTLNERKTTDTKDLTVKLAALNLKQTLTGEESTLKSDIEDRLSTYDEYYSTLSKTAQTNPDAVRGYLQTQEVTDHYTSMYSPKITKEEFLENPAVNMELKLNKQALDVSKDAWDRKMDLANLQLMKERVDIARMAAKKRGGVRGLKNTSDDGSGTDVEGDLNWEQADEPSEGMLLRFQDEFNTAKTAYNQNTDMFIWESMLSKIPSNVKKLDSLMSGSGRLSKEDAISLMISGIAKQNKEPLEVTRARFTTKAQEVISSVSPVDLDSKPSLREAYSRYTQSNNVLTNLSLVDQYIKKAAGSVAPSSQEALQELEKMQPVSVELGGRKYNLSKQDMYDLALYIAGKTNPVGFLENSQVREQANAAGKRLESRGLGPVMEDKILRPSFFDSPFSAIGRSSYQAGKKALSQFFVPAGGGATNFMYGMSSISNDTKNAYEQIGKIANLLSSSQYAAGLKAQADALTSVYYKQPSVKANLLTGNTTIDAGIRKKLGAIAGAYTTGQKQNLSSSFGNFMEIMSNKDSYIETNIRPTATGSMPVEIITYSSDGKNSASMVVQNDEAKNLDINVDDLYEDPTISTLRSRIAVSPGNRTCAGDILKPETYKREIPALQKDFFTGMSRSKIDVKGNIEYTNGKYYPHIYVNDFKNGSTGKVVSLEGNSDLNALLQSLKIQFVPSFAQAALIK